MSHKKYFSYIRVSTQRQGQHGTSLTEQQAAIDLFATTWNLKITQGFEERETAAKQGRPVFLDMLKQLKLGKADGVVMHKIDRSARNLKDWADLGTLIDAGIEVRFASESIDLNSRGGRLSADIQAVVASDYIRNLREETKKGIYGRLKQGYFPFRAPTGYLDRGTAKPKEIDPVQGPLVRNAFELYATGNWSLLELTDKLSEMGLTTRAGGRVSRNGLSTILHNPFYFGLMQIPKRGELYRGTHEPLITKALYDKVQAVLEGKQIRKITTHDFQFRRTVRCVVCRNFMVPELQKSYVYYRCHTRFCERAILKEETIDKECLRAFKSIQMTDEDFAFFERESRREIAGSSGNIENDRAVITKRLARLSERMSNLTDALIDGVIDREVFAAKRDALTLEEETLKEKLKKLSDERDRMATDLDLLLELANSAYLSYISGRPENKRDLIDLVSSNFYASGKSCLIELKKPFLLLASRPGVQGGCPIGAEDRTISALVSQVLLSLRQNSFITPQIQVGNNA